MDPQQSPLEALHKRTIELLKALADKDELLEKAESQVAAQDKLLEHLKKQVKAAEEIMTQQMEAMKDQMTVLQSLRRTVEIQEKLGNILEAELYRIAPDRAAQLFNKDAPSRQSAGQPEPSSSAPAANKEQAKKKRRPRKPRCLGEIADYNEPGHGDKAFDASQPRLSRN